MKKVLITSSLIYDYIMNFDGTYEEFIIPEKIKTLNLTFQLENLDRNFGGNGGNFAHSLNLLGVKSAVITSVGEKDFDPYMKYLTKMNVDTRYINVVKDMFTANCFIMTDSLHCQITGFYPGPMIHDHELSIKNVKDLDKFDFLLISTSTPASITKFAKEATEKKMRYLFAPGQETQRVSKEQLTTGIKGAEIIVVNDYELALIEKITGMKKKDLLKSAKIVITTLGAHGSEIATQKGEIIKVPVAQPKKAVDPTGVGDAYISGFTTGYIHDLPLKTCGQIGALIATYCLEQYGTQIHKFTMEEFKKRYKEAFNEDLPLF
jgi:adenosine kinase